MGAHVQQKLFALCYLCMAWQKTTGRLGQGKLQLLWNDFFMAEQARDAGMKFIQVRRYWLISACSKSLDLRYGMMEDKDGWPG